MQVLFGFLLSVPFTQRFAPLDAGQRALYFATVLAAGAAVLFLLAPGAWHRVLFTQGDKAHVVEVSQRFAILGMVFVALSVCGVLVLITSVLYPGAAVAAVAAGAVTAFAVCWAALPLRRRRRVRSAPTPSAPAHQPARNAGSTRSR